MDVYVRVCVYVSVCVHVCLRVYVCVFVCECVPILYASLCAAKQRFDEGEREGNKLVEAAKVCVVQPSKY